MLPRTLKRALSAAPAPLPLSSLTGVSSIDGRYGPQTASLRPWLSEYALIKHRVVVELEWLRVLSSGKQGGVQALPPLDSAAEKVLSDIVSNFGLAGAERVKAIEATTNHDVKAVEYYLKECFAASGNAQLAAASEFLHFAATSEDVNNLAYALMVKGARDAVVVPAATALLEAVVGKAEELADTPMLSRTHGQPATPTTMGKEWANWAHRMGRQLVHVRGVPALGKFNGAVGNFNAHATAYPGVDWARASRTLVEGHLGLAYQPYSTQIEPHDWLGEVAHATSRLNTVVLDLDRDVWGYISLGYFRQRQVAGEVGSSTMPHKVNPIDFENSEGNCGLANALLGHLADKLPVSRFQRDLSDSTVLRSLGSGFAHTLLALRSASKGIGKLQADNKAMADDLESRWEVLAEPIQTVMRRYGAPKPYEQLKDLTRGQGAFNAAGIHAFVRKLGQEKQIPAAAVEDLLKLTPSNYLGIAPALARDVRRVLKEDMGIKLK